MNSAVEAVAVVVVLIRIKMIAPVAAAAAVRPLEYPRTDLQTVVGSYSHLQTILLLDSAEAEQVVLLIRTTHPQA